MEILQKFSLYTFAWELIRTVTVFFPAMIVFFKSLKIKLEIKAWLTAAAISVAASAIIIATNGEQLNNGNLIRYLIIIIFLTLYARQSKRATLAVSLICISLSYAIFILSVIIIGTVSWLIQTHMRLIGDAVGCIVCVITAVLLMKIRRFRNGIQFFNNEENLGLGLVISALSFIVTNLGLADESTPMFIELILVFGIVIAGFGLYFWIKKGITAHYRERMQLKTEIYYKEKLEDRELYIEQLEKSNEFLAKAMHRDNHLMNALGAAIQGCERAESEEKRKKLLGELKAMADERNGLIRQEQAEADILPSTGNSVIDSALADMYIKAASKGIAFYMTAPQQLVPLINNGSITQTELATLLCDHIKDAIIAIESLKNVKGKILLDISRKGSAITLTLSDNGAEFDSDILAKLGIERVTSHADSGGSGYGFMTTFETLRKSKASLEIIEHKAEGGFTKSIVFKFDGKNKFIIRSYRKAELKQKLSRKDVILK